MLCVGFWARLGLFGFSVLGAATAAAEIDGADIDKGKAKSRICTSCHGPTGISRIPGYPHLAGQDARYLQQQLLAYKRGERVNGQMNSIARNLSEEDIANLSAYFAQLPAFYGATLKPR